MNIGPLEIIIVIVVLLLLFGARRLPDLGRNLGGGIRGFGKAVTGDEDESRDAEQARVAAAAPKTPPVAERPAEKTPPRVES
ncbi:MAG TPA: twin-arginine translocase TatA/TatE family subunit [Solirubrobacterales bacterium]|nr:twin-arginine translocase TatA/TatE family subunit [Solirubrobacterales bacterium]